MHSLRISCVRATFSSAKPGSSRAALKCEKPLAEPRGDDLRRQAEDRAESFEYLGVEPVYDLTEPATHHFVANGIVATTAPSTVLDDTACNLASLNLMRFYDAAANRFDVEAYRHATCL